MSFGINGPSNSGAGNQVGARARAQGAPAAGGAAPGMSGDSLSLTKKDNTILDDVQQMSPKQAESNRNLGGKMAVGGLLLTMGGWWAAGAAAGTSLAFLPPLAIAVGVGVGLWGAIKLGKGLAAGFNQQIQKANQGLPEQ